MQFTLERSSAHLISGYASGEVRVNGRSFDRSIIVTPERLVENWRATVAAQLTSDDLEPILALEPELIVLGTGPRLVFPDQALIARILERGIGIEVMGNGAACRTYNILVHEGRSVALGLMLAPDPVS